MGNEKLKTEGLVDIPTQVFEKFLENLGEIGTSADLMARLRKTLIEDNAFTDRALKIAIFPEEPLK